MKPQVIALRNRSEDKERFSDEAVAHACESGDPRAVAEIFERYHSVVMRYLTRAASRDEAEDMVQATFLQIARGQVRFDGRSTVRTWVLGIATNILRQHFRTTARRRRLHWALSLVEPSRGDTDLVRQVAARRDIEGVRLALAALSEKTRLAFLLCEVEGLSAKEASVVLDASENTIWKRVSDARKCLLKAAEESQS